METKNISTENAFTIDLTGWKGIIAGAVSGAIIGLFGIWNYHRGLKRGVGEVAIMLYESGAINEENADEIRKKLTAYFDHMKKIRKFRNSL